MEEHEARPWRTVEELIALGYQRSRVVMMNECHAYMVSLDNAMEEWCPQE